MSEVPDHKNEEEFLAEMRAAAEALEQCQYDEAREHVERMDELAYCDICERLVEGTSSGVFFVTALLPKRRARRAQQVADELFYTLDGAEETETEDPEVKA